MEDLPLTLEDLELALQYRLIPSSRSATVAPSTNIFVRRALVYIRRPHTSIGTSSLYPDLDSVREVLVNVMRITDDQIRALSMEDKRTAFRMLHLRAILFVGSNLPFHRMAGDRHKVIAMRLSEAFVLTPSGIILMGETEIGEAAEIRKELEETHKAIQTLRSKLLRERIQEQEDMRNAAIRVSDGMESNARRRAYPISGLFPPEEPQLSGRSEFGPTWADFNTDGLVSRPGFGANSSGRGGNGLR